MVDTTTMPGKPLLVARTPGIWFACLNRPDKRNALTEQLVAALGDVLRRVADDPEARALVLCGAGGHFCAGADFAGLDEAMTADPFGSDDAIARHSRRFGTLLEQLAALPVPTIAVVTGAAIGGGCGLAATCNRVIAADTAVLAMPEVTLGVAPAQIAPFVARRIGAGPARWLMLTASRLNAAAALATGLADVVAPLSGLRAAVTAELGLLAAAEPAAVRATMRILQRTVHEPLPAVLDAAALEFAALLRRGAADEGIAAARERRRPAWQLAAPELPDFL